MIKNIILILTLCIFTNGTVNAEEDTRQYVKFLPKLQLKQMSNMRDYMAALNEILESLVFDKLDEAADIAEKRLGFSAASHFAEITKKGDLESVYEALIPVTQSCVECYASYRSRK